MAKHLNFEPGSVGEYYDGPIGDRVLIREVYHSTCFHCGHGTEFPSKRDMMEHVEICRGCMHLICLGCYGKPCTPQEKEAERLEAEARLRARIEGGGFRCY
jgi:hypothetical protein